MKVRLYALIIFLLFGTIGCYATITGTVVDAETGEPIEGAVVLVEWTKTHGFGLTYTESYKVIEAVTDKEGKVIVSGVFNPTVNPPQVTVYKKGYVAWNNEFIFPNYRHREDFKYKDKITIKIERFKEVYSYDNHVDFIRLCINSTLNLEAKKKIFEVFEWERDLALQERLKKMPRP
jgi:hypothetical protein